MSEDALERDVLGRVGMGRREFVKKLIIGTAFAVPVISSFSMASLSAAPGDALTGYRPGNGYGDQNHIHTGPPGQTQK